MRTNHFFSKLLLACVVLTIVFSGCDPSTKTKINDFKLDQIKSGNYDVLDGKSLSLQGFLAFDGEGNPMIVRSLDILNQNTILNEKDYLRLEISDVGRLDAEALYGATVKVTGRLEESKNEQDLIMADVLGKVSLVQLHLSETPKVIQARPQDFIYPIAYNICERYPAICELSFVNSSKNYAMLFSGGVNSSNAHARYWNDLRFMYQTLKSKYGYDDAHIILVYKNGVPGDAMGDIPVDYPASIVGVNAAFDFLKTKLDNNDQLFFFATNHGGGFNTAENLNYSGIVDGSGDEIDAKGYDETIFYYNEAGNISDDFFASKVASLNYGKFIAVLEPCFSGGFLRDLRGPKNIVISAANEFEFSWAKGPTYQYDEFSYYYTSALNGYTPEGAYIKPAADSNGDGQVSILEAFVYAKTHDAAAEHPLYEDNGDGVGTSNPTTVGEGSVGASTFLN